MPFTVGIITLGCKVNQYESEALAENFANAGFAVLEPSLPCDVYVINTCTVTAESDRKSRQMTRRVMLLNPEARVIVTGCLSQVSPSAVASIPGVDFVCGSRNKNRVVGAALELLEGKKPCKAAIEVKGTADNGFEPMRITRFPRTRAYIKIEDGCESNCSYCIIPRARGKICSKQPLDILDEINCLISGGCREAVLTGIETASYGVDLDGYRLSDLLCDIDRIAAGKMRIRLGSLDPSLIRPDFVAKISGLSSLAPHFHLSMQSGSDRILGLMRRKYNTQMAYSGITLLREAVRDVRFTSDFIAGFPGETEADFEETVAFCERVGFLDSHIFTYSRRAGTPAASMPEQVSAQTAHIRTNRLIEVQKGITESVLEGEKGREYEVLFETDGKGFSSGHTPSFIEVRVKSDSPLHAAVRRVRITGHADGVAIGAIV